MDAPLLATLAQHIQQPHTVTYRETMAGRIDTHTLLQHADLLKSIRRHTTHITQARLTSLLQQVADAKEEQWHLANEKSMFAATVSKYIRVMLRDVAQNIIKHKDKPVDKTPQWLRTFVDDDDDDGGDAIQDCGDDDDDRDGCEEALSEGEEGEEEAKETEDEQIIEPEPPRTVKKPSLEPQRILKKPSSAPMQYGWDEEMFTAWRLAAGKKVRDYL